MKTAVCYMSTTPFRLFYVLSSFSTSKTLYQIEGKMRFDSESHFKTIFTFIYIYNKFRFNVILLSQTDEINIGVCVLFWWFGLPSWTWKFILCCNLMGFLIITFLLQTGLLCNRIRKMQLYWFENNPLTNERMNEWSNNEREYWITVR